MTFEHRAAIPQIHRGTRAASEALHQAGLVRQELCRSGESLPQAGVEVLLEVGEQVVAHPVASEATVGVGGVFPEAQAPRTQVGEDLLPRHLEQGPEDVATSRLHASKPTGPTAAEEAEQECLGLVVPGVGHRDHAGTGLPTHAPQECITRATPGLLDATPAL